MWELQILAINHSVVFQPSWKTKRKALGFTAHSALFVLSAKSIPLPSMEFLWFGNDFLAGSVCLHLRPQTRISEVSHKWKFVLPFSSFGRRASACARYLCHFSKHLENENINSPIQAQGLSWVQFWEHKHRRQSRRLSNACPWLEPSWPCCGWAVGAVGQLWMSHGSAVGAGSQGSISSTTQPSGASNARIPLEPVNSLPQVLNTLAWRSTGRTGTKATAGAVVL